MFKMDFEYTRSLKNFTDKLVTILDLRELMGTIVENISTTLKVDNVALLTIDKKNRMFSVKASVGFDTTVRGITVREDNPLIVWLKGKVRERKQMAIRTALLEGMYSPETELISCMDLFKAELCIPLFFYEQLIAVITISIKKSGDIYSSEDLNMLKTLSNQASIALSNAFAYDDMRKTYLGTIEALAMAIEAKDQYTRGHSERVVKVAMEIAREMGIPRDQIELLQYAGILHDIGKIAIDDEILKKNTTLTEEEFMAIMEHPAAGESIVAPISFLDGVRTIIRHHHERWDGRGYPDRLAYESIPLLSRILTVADTFDAITSARSYRPARSHDEAVSELQRCAGKQFDPEVVEYFVAAYKKGRIS
jgi:putative nucleotidyltransferase with HDIG domain